MAFMTRETEIEFSRKKLGFSSRFTLSFYMVDLRINETLANPHLSRMPIFTGAVRNHTYPGAKVSIYF